MSVSSRSGVHDVVVIGAGMSGLAAGALLARAGRGVLVVESENRPGGYARSLEADGYRFQQALHFVMGGNPTGPYGPGFIHEALDLLGVADRCELIGVDDFYTARFPGMTLNVPTGKDAYLEAHIERFPDEEDGLRRLVDTCSGLYRELLSLPIRPRLVDWLTIPVHSPSVVRYRKATLERIVNRHLTDPQLKAVYSALAPYYVGLPPSRASFAVWAYMMASYIEEGAYYCRGGFQRLADAFAEALQNHGGELLLGRRVRRITLDGDRVKGIELDDGQRIVARQVVSTIDARDTFGSLIPEAELPQRWMRRIHGTELCTHVDALYLGTDLDLRQLDTPAETLVYRTWVQEEVLRPRHNGQFQGATVTVPTLLTPDLAPPGRHQIVVKCIADQDLLGANAEGVAADLVQLVEQAIPGLGDHIVYALGASHGPTGPDRLPLHRIGPMYGWANSPENAGPNRLPQTTPVKGLYLAGQWTQPGHGIETVIGSGIRAARLILHRDTDVGLRPLSSR